MENNPFSQPADGLESRIVGGRYSLPHPITKAAASWTRTTSFISKIADHYSIHQWETKMILQGLVLREDLYTEACALPFSDRKAFLSLASRAKDAAGGNTGARTGTAMHSFTERAKRGVPTRAPRKWSGRVEQYMDTLARYWITPQEELLERTVINLTYGCAGTFDDAFITADLGLVVGDTKTQSEIYSYCDVSMQLAMYAYADAMWNEERRCYEDMPQFNREVALVVWLPLKKPNCEVRQVDIGSGWTALKLCSDVHEWQKRGKRKDDLGRAYVPGLITTIERYAQRMVDADNLIELSEVAAEAQTKALWGPELEKVFSRRTEVLSTPV